MPDAPDPDAARWIPLLVVGMSLNTIGIVLRDLGPARYALMGAGLLLLLVAVVKLLGARRDAGGPPAQP